MNSELWRESVVTKRKWLFIPSSYKVLSYNTKSGRYVNKSFKHWKIYLENIFWGVQIDQCIRDKDIRMQRNTDVTILDREPTKRIYVEGIPDALWPKTLLVSVLHRRGKHVKSRRFTSSMKWGKETCNMWLPQFLVWYNRTLWFEEFDRL